MAKARIGPSSAQILQAIGIDYMNRIRSFDAGELRKSYRQSPRCCSVPFGAETLAKRLDASAKRSQHSQNQGEAGTGDVSQTVHTYGSVQQDIQTRSTASQPQVMHLCQEYAAPFGKSIQLHSRQRQTSGRRLPPAALQRRPMLPDAPAWVMTVMSIVDR